MEERPNAAAAVSNRDQVARDIHQLAGLIRVRNELEGLIAELIGRPATTGNIGEWVASRIFDIELHPTGVHAGSDGVFRSGALAGRSVNVKTYSKYEGMLDIGDHPADYYLVLVGPRSAPAIPGTSRRLPFTVEAVYLFDMPALRSALQAGGIKTGIATSVRNDLWEAQRLYPGESHPVVKLEGWQLAALSELKWGGT